MLIKNISKMTITKNTHATDRPLPLASTAAKTMEITVNICFMWYLGTHMIHPV
jgi:hypothetical protein